MRRTLAVTAIACGTVALLAWPASAKGYEEHSTITIRGPGLSAPIILTHEEAATFMYRSGGGQPKWDVPNIGGALTPNADLGASYTAVVHLRCGGGVHSAYRQTLYPYAPGGLQVYTPGNSEGCFSEQFSTGYWPAADELLRLLEKHGLPAPNADQGTGGGAVQASPQAAVVDTGGGSFGAGTAVAVSLIAALTLLAGALIVRRRRAA